MEASESHINFLMLLLFSTIFAKFTHAYINMNLNEQMEAFEPRIALFGIYESLNCQFCSK